MAAKVKGTVVERSPGHWWIRVYAGRNERGRPIQVSRTVRGTKRQAQEALAELSSQVASGQTALPSNLSVGQLLERWLDHITPSREPGTTRGYATHIRAIDEQIGAVKLAKLTALQLDKAYAAWLRMGLSPNTVHHRHAILRTALRQAVKWGLVPRAATDKASPPPLRSKPIAAVPADDVLRLYEAAGEDQPTLALAIYLAAATGLRRGELCALRWSDIDESGVLHVHAAAKHGLESRQVEIRDTKTHQDRKVALGETALAVLSAYRADLVRAATKVGLELPADAFILSLDPLGGVPMKPDSLGQAFRRVARRLGMDIRFHDLRHFTATQLIGAGVDVRTVAARLGHADPALTLRVYASFMEEQDRKAANIMAGVLKPGAA